MRMSVVILATNVRQWLGLHMAKRSDVLTSPPEPAPSPPPTESAGVDSTADDPRRSADAFRVSDFVLTEIAKLQTAVSVLQTAGEYTKRELVEVRTDMRDLRRDVRDLRDRMSKLEARVDHLPSKGFIVVVVTIALTIIGGLLSVAPKLQSWVGAAPALSAPQSQNEGPAPAFAPPQKWARNPGTGP
jgi:hypothetical protein